MLSDARQILLLVPLLVMSAAAPAAEHDRFTPEQIQFFETDVRPILVAKCYECHSTDAEEVQAGLYVDSRRGLLQGGETGPAIVEGKPDESPLIAAIRYESTEMPPDGKLSGRHIKILIRWVEMGAPWPEFTTSPAPPVTGGEIDWSAARESHWAWQPVKKPALPHIRPGLGRHPIDAFVAARRRETGVAPNPPVAPAQLARRIFVDLIGILPTPEQIAHFVDAVGVDRNQAINQLVDQLLDSPKYGQRWARHWLDVARYSDGHGGFLDGQGLDQAWRYRDWVVDSLNDDLPIDEFLRLQIAGDIVGDRESAIATGFFALGPSYHSDGGDPDSQAQARGETLEDRVDLLTRGVLGVTGTCARCHDHKFDPIPQQDYYSLAGIFNNTAIQDLPLAPQEVVDRFNQHRQAIEQLKKQSKELRKKISREKREATTQEKRQLDGWQNELKEKQTDPPPEYDTAHALREAGNQDMHIAIRGNLRKTGERAPRRFLRILAGPEPPRFTSGSGRAELANAVVDPNNPLTARVFVNRVWMHHFGAGLVRTPSNFGVLGQRPTHPLLLDWLAADFMEHGWSLKRLHRQIISSSAYQLSSAHSASAYEQDGDNRLLWRMSPRRMDVEAWRDAVLGVTGELDCKLGGPPTDNLVGDRRRTLYAKVSRNGDVFASDAFLRRFDFPLMRATVAQRPHSIVPQQYLFLLNSQFMADRAKAFVRRLESLSSHDAQKIEAAYQLLYSRRPTRAEIHLGLAYLQSSSAGEGQLTPWDRYAQTLLSSNEFMFIR